MTLDASIHKDAEGQFKVIPYEQIRCRNLLDNGRLCDKWIAAANKNMIIVGKTATWDLRIYCPRCKGFTYFKKLT